MDGRGRFAEPLIRWIDQRLRAVPGVLGNHAQLVAVLEECGRTAVDAARATDRVAARVARRVAAVKPRHAGAVAATALIVGAIGYGVVRGDHVPVIRATLADLRDQAAIAAGFRITELDIGGHRRLNEEEILTLAGVTPRKALLFFDVDAARQGLEASPWIAQATVRKLYPGRIEITLREREPYAVWQADGRLSVVAADGTVLEPYGTRPMPDLPQVVGQGAAERAEALVTLLDRHPVLRGQLRAAVRVAERRWNLKLQNGLDIRLPEQDVAGALELLMALDQDRRILSRDITAIDLRLPGRVSVRLSEDAAKARSDAAAERRKRRGGNA